MKYILFPAFLVFSFGTLWAQEAPAPAAAAEPAAATAEEGEGRWSDFLPLNKEMAGDADMPLPLGIGVTSYYQSQGMKLNSMDLTIVAPTQTETAIPGVSASNLESKVHNYNLRVDGWVLPFLNVYGVLGQIEGKTSVATITGDPATIGAFMVAPPTAWTAPYLTSAGSPLTAGSAGLLYEGSVYGAGFILAGEYKNLWGTIDFNLTRTDLDIASSEIDAWTLTPRVGITRELDGKKTLLWIGAMHQEVDETQSGNWTLSGAPDATVNYNVKTEMEEKWNFLVGGSINLTEEMDLAIEGGFGDRESFMGSLTYRF